MSNLKEPTTVTISLDTAIERTSNWRNFLINTKQVESVRKIPKAVYISRADIEALAASLAKDDTLTGARAYFTINEPFAEEVKNDVRFVMVLVRENGTHGGQDVIYLPGSTPGGTDDSDIYDFTKPCPEYCDPDSPLFSGDPRVK